MNAATPFSDQRHYGSSNLRTERDYEYEAFSRVTRMLNRAHDNPTGANKCEAIHMNNELWTILASDLAQPGNALDPETKAGLISLAGFSVRQGLAVLNGDNDIAPLIDVNISVMKGLRGESVE